MGHLTEPLALIIVALISGAANIAIVFITLSLKNKIKNVHKEINGRMGELMEVTKKASKAEGNLEGREELKEEQNGGTH